MEAEQKKQAFEGKDPNSAAAKKNARVGGGIVFILGLALIGANYWTWTSMGSVWVLAIAAMIAFIGLGLYAMITGKMPRKRN